MINGSGACSARGGAGASGRRDAFGELGCPVVELGD